MEEDESEGIYVPPDNNPFEVTTFAAIFDGSAQHRKASLRNAIDSVYRLTEWLKDPQVRGDTEFYKRENHDYELGFAIEDLHAVALEVKWADPTPVESAPGTPTPMETQADPTTPRAVVPPPAMPKPRAPARDADVPMGPADPLPKAAGAPKKAAPAVKPLEQRKKPIRPFQPPPINLQTKPKLSYAKATARSPLSRALSVLRWSRARFM